MCAIFILGQENISQFWNLVRTAVSICKDFYKLANTEKNA